MCCGRGTLEIKCSYSHRGESVELASEDKNFCLKRASDGMLHLDPKHAYYYQIQTQIFVCDVEYCDFCLCTFNGDESGLHIERVYKDTSLWNDCVERAESFFRTCILPELLGKTVYKVKQQKTTASLHLPETVTTPDCDQQQAKYCHCTNTVT